MIDILFLSPNYYLNSNRVILLYILFINNNIYLNLSISYSSVSMAKTKQQSQFDWYCLSKINPDYPNVDNFAKLIKQSHMNNNLRNIPLNYRKQLLIIFQNCSKQLKQQYQNNCQSNNQLEFQKSTLTQQISMQKYQLENSLIRINSLKMEVDKKKNTVDKFKKKIIQKKNQVNINHNSGKEMYYCVFCERNDFANRETFALHMYRDHQTITNSNKESNKMEVDSQANSELKDILLSLKDKQLQLMEMLLSKNKQMQTQELQKLYEQELKKMHERPTFHERRSMKQFSNNQLKNSKPATYNYSHYSNQYQQMHKGIGEDEELKGESQYLFYQQDLNNQQQHDKFQERQEIQPRQQKKRHEYFDIFASDVMGLAENQSKYEEQINDQDPIHRRLSVNNHLHKQPNNFDSKNNVRSAKQININPNIQATTKKEEKLQITSKVFNPSHNHEISERKHYSTMYDNSLNTSRKKLHIFNSGPLMDDDSDGSDFQDYFRADGRIQQNHEEVDDEQITIGHHNFSSPHTNIRKNEQKHSFRYNNKEKYQQDNSEQFQRINFDQSRSNNNSNIILEYSKDRTQLDISKSKAKDEEQSLDQIQFSKNNSSNDYTINLSDLKLSKLEKQKQRIQKQKQKQKQRIQTQSQKQSMLKQKEIQRKSQLEQQHSVRKMNFVKKLTTQVNSRSNGNILDQFKRDLVFLDQFIDNSQTSNAQINNAKPNNGKHKSIAVKNQKLKKNFQSSSFNSYQNSQSSVLDQFLMK